jgi:hypothetical protein
MEQDRSPDSLVNVALYRDTPLFRFPQNGVFGNVRFEICPAVRTFYENRGPWKCRPDGKRGKHKAVSHASHSPWKSPKNGDYHIPTARRRLRSYTDISIRHAIETFLSGGNTACITEELLIERLIEKQPWRSDIFSVSGIPGGAVPLRGVRSSRRLRSKRGIATWISC